METRDRIKSMSVPAGGTIREAMKAIDRGALGTAFLVTDDGRFAGLVSDGDVRRALLGGHGLETPASEISRPEARKARVGMSAAEIAELFSERVRLVPVLDDTDRIVDVIVFDKRVHLQVAEPSMGEEELINVTECVLTNWVSSGGRFVTMLEERFADFCGCKYAVAVNTGTAALHLALLALGIGRGDEVIVPSLTFIATANAVAYCGATPVFVDSEPDSWNIDPVFVEAAITPRTKAIVPVHLYGHPANMDPIAEIASRHNLAVIEDAAEAHGALYKGRRVGGIGDLGVFSFYGNKIVTTGEGGMIVTNRKDVAEAMAILRNHGMRPERRYWHETLGYNYRLTNLQAAVGVAQMDKIEPILAAKRRIARTYTEYLKDLPGITLPPEMDWAHNVFWLYSILVDESVAGIGRDALMEALQSAGVETRPLFPPLHTQPIYATGQSLPVAERLAATGLSLPSAVGLTDEDASHVAESVRAAFSTQRV